MTLVQRHMFYRLLGHAAAAGAVSGFIILLIMAQPLFYLLAEHVLSFRIFLLACAVIAPDPVYRALPFAICIAIVHDYTRWGRNNEIISLRMAGMPNLGLAIPGLAAAGVVTVLAAATSLYIAPLASRALDDIRYGAYFKLSLRLLDEGYLQQVAPDLSVSFRKRLGPNEIGGVTILDSSKAGEIKYIMAESAELQNPEGATEKRVLVLRQGSYQVRDDSGERQAPVDFQELILPIAESADGSPSVRGWRGAYEQHIGVLLDPPPDVAQDSNLYGDYVSLGHLRIGAPLSCLSCAIFVLGLMLAARYEQRSAPILSMAAALAGTALWQGLLVGSYFAVYHRPSLAPLLYVVAIAPAAVGAPFLRSRTPRAPRGVQRLAGMPSPASTTEI